MSRTTCLRAVALGLAGGLSGTVVMDLAVAGVFTAMGLPVGSSFGFIGDTAALGLAILGIHVAGGILLGTAMHYLIGLVLGVAFGLVASAERAPRIDTSKRGVLFGILYIEVVSLPILATAPILRTMTLSETAQWLGLSFAMHMVCGAVLGLVMSHGLRRPDRARGRHERSLRGRDRAGLA
ncbi:MAG: DUF6789 family protein [Anaerolineae bacterium]